MITWEAPAPFEVVVQGDVLVIRKQDAGTQKGKFSQEFFMTYDEQRSGKAASVKLTLPKFKLLEWSSTPPKHTQNSGATTVYIW